VDVAVVDQDHVDHHPSLRLGGGLIMERPVFLAEPTPSLCLSRDCGEFPLS
jgi:hypothetical protein